MQSTCGLRTKLTTFSRKAGEAASDALKKWLFFFLHLIRKNHCHCLKYGGGGGAAPWISLLAHYCSAMILKSLADAVAVIPAHIGFFYDRD